MGQISSSTAVAPQVGGKLDLRSNNLQSLPESFGRLKIGGGLNLRSNSLRTLPESFRNIKVGQNLNLRGNNLTEEAQGIARGAEVKGETFIGYA